jgi:hypothetical protein
MLNFEIYAPINIPINWQSELITDNEQRYSLLQKHFPTIKGVSIQPNNWPMGFGSLEHDNFPVFYQPSAILEIQTFEVENDVSHANLYIYDNCLAVLNLGLTVNTDILNIDDLVVTKRVEELSQQYLAPILKSIYPIKPKAPLINVSAYKLFSNNKDALTNAKPLWVARMLTQDQQVSSEYYLDWLKNIDAKNEFLQLGSGNSLLTNEQYFSDVHRIMVVSQFHAALMDRIEGLLKGNLKSFNGNYYNKNVLDSLDSSFSNQQYRNDHIEYINIQVSATEAGVQGRRRELFQQFNVAWKFNEQQERVNQLTSLTQARIDRLLQSKLRQRSRSIQTLLAFLGSLGLISLIVDLIGVENDVNHDNTVGLLDIIQFFPAEHLLGLTVIIVILLTFYFYKNHE